MYNPLYQNYYPVNYGQQLYSNQNQQAHQNNSLTWVQGEAAAKAYPVGAGNSVLLMDSEDAIFYIKSTDQSGMPQPLRIFDYTERTTQHTSAAAKSSTPDEYVTRAEFDEFKKTITGAGGEG